MMIDANETEAMNECMAKLKDAYLSVVSEELHNMILKQDTMQLYLSANETQDGLSTQQDFSHLLEQVLKRHEMNRSMHTATGLAHDNSHSDYRVLQSTDMSNKTVSLSNFSNSNSKLNKVMLTLSNNFHFYNNSNNRLYRRHYKKDSRFVLDLYTLTYDSHESLDSFGDLTSRRNGREEIRENFVLGDENTKRRIRKQSLNSRLQQNENMGICYVNEAVNEMDLLKEQDQDKNVKYKNGHMVTNMLRNSLKKVGAELGVEKRRLSRQMLTNMNTKQLQAISKDLHIYIRHLNETLMRLLMERDELHMSQDSLLVDVQDITARLNGKMEWNAQNENTKDLYLCNDTSSAKSCNISHQHLLGHS